MAVNLTYIALYEWYSHAPIKEIDTSRALQLEDSRCPDGADIPGLNGYGIAVPDQPVLCDRKVRYLGDPVALVVGVAVGVRTFDLPATPEKVYRLLQAKSRTTQWERAKGQEASL